VAKKKLARRNQTFIAQKNGWICEHTRSRRSQNEPQNKKHRSGPECESCTIRCLLGTRSAQ
jgi:hypothetical protein